MSKNNKAPAGNGKTTETLNTGEYEHNKSSVGR